MIGILDSGVGGLSIYREVKVRYPEYGVIYFADKANFPYGEKTTEELNRIVSAAITRLIDLGAKVVIVACNSATISTIASLRKDFDIPIVGIEPAVKPAAQHTRNHKIGVLATAITTKDHESEALAPDCQLVKCHNATLISKIENDYTHVTDVDLQNALQPMIAEGVDSVVLGCTHYHFIKERLEELYPEITFHAPEQAVVNRLAEVIANNHIELSSGDDIFLCSADLDGFAKSLSNLLGIDHADIREV